MSNCSLKGSFCPVIMLVLLIVIVICNACPSPKIQTSNKVSLSNKQPVVFPVGWKYPEIGVPDNSWKNTVSFLYLRPNEGLIYSKELQLDLGGKRYVVGFFGDYDYDTLISYLESIVQKLGLKLVDQDLNQWAPLSTSKRTEFANDDDSVVLMVTYENFKGNTDFPAFETYEYTLDIK